MFASCERQPFAPSFSSFFHVKQPLSYPARISTTPHRYKEPYQTRLRLNHTFNKAIHQQNRLLFLPHTIPIHHEVLATQPSPRPHRLPPPQSCDYPAPRLNRLSTSAEPFHSPDPATTSLESREYAGNILITGMCYKQDLPNKCLLSTLTRNGCKSSFPSSSLCPSSPPHFSISLKVGSSEQGN
jgi:hypothetical protein